MKPLVSVVVPVYNGARYLPQCLDSLVSQTLREIEIILVNDRSNRWITNILLDYASRYPEQNCRHRLTRQPQARRCTELGHPGGAS